MTLNPITALSEQLQKLINEHGSAAILRDHLALFKDQVVLLEKKNIDLTAENAALVSEIHSLQSKIEILGTKVQQLTKDNEEFREKIQNYEQPNHANLLDETKIDILKLLFKQDKLPTEEIAQIMGYAIQTTKFHLEELKLNQMVKDIPYTRNRKPVVGWYLQQEGRRYLIENKIAS
jgi:Skp family chaperone for outer membrane proteins